MRCGWAGPPLAALGGGSGLQRSAQGRWGGGCRGGVQKMGGFPPVSARFCARGAPCPDSVSRVRAASTPAGSRSWGQLTAPRGQVGHKMRATHQPFSEGKMKNLGGASCHLLARFRWPTAIGTHKRTAARAAAPPSAATLPSTACPTDGLHWTGLGLTRWPSSGATAPPSSPTAVAVARAEGTMFLRRGWPGRTAGVVCVT